MNNPWNLTHALIHTGTCTMYITSFNINMIKTQIHSIWYSSPLFVRYNKTVTALEISEYQNCQPRWGYFPRTKALRKITPPLVDNFRYSPLPRAVIVYCNSVGRLYSYKQPKQNKPHFHIKQESAISNLEFTISVSCLKVISSSITVFTVYPGFIWTPWYYWMIANSDMKLHLSKKKTKEPFSLFSVMSGEYIIVEYSHHF